MKGCVRHEAEERNQNGRHRFCRGVDFALHWLEARQSSLLVVALGFEPALDLVSLNRCPRSCYCRSRRLKESGRKRTAVWGKTLRPWSGLRDSLFALRAVSVKSHRPLDGLWESPRSRSETGQRPEPLGGLAKPSDLWAAWGNPSRPRSETRQSPPTFGRLGESSNLGRNPAKPTDLLAV